MISQYLYVGIFKFLWIIIMLESLLNAESDPQIKEALEQLHDASKNSPTQILEAISKADP